MTIVRGPEGFVSGTRSRGRFAEYYIDNQLIIIIDLRSVNNNIVIDGRTEGSIRLKVSPFCTPSPVIYFIASSSSSSSSEKEECFGNCFSLERSSIRELFAKSTEISEKLIGCQTLSPRYGLTAQTR